MISRLSLRSSILIILAVFLGVVAVTWVGFLASDDATYARGAYGWIEDFPYVGGHGTIRFTITIPVALSFLAFGGSEFALILPSLLYSLCLVALLIYAVWRMAGQKAMLMIAPLLVTLPVLVSSASVASVDVIEALFVVASFQCFLIAGEREKRLWWLLGAGGLAAFGFLTRETTAFLLVYYGLLFLMGAVIERRQYWIMAGGFFAMWLQEILYLTIMTGDPLYRLNISSHHDSTIDRTIDLAGNVIVHPVVDPLLVILLNQEFTILFWVAIPVLAWYFLRNRKGAVGSPQVRRVAGLWLGLAATWFVVVGAATTLLPLNPRYFLVTALAVLPSLAVAFSALCRVGRQKAVGLVLMAAVGLNLAALYIENRNYIFGVEQFAAWTDAADAPVHADAETIRRATILLKWSGAGDKASVAEAQAGELVFVDPARTPHLLEQARAENWPLVSKAHPAPKLLVPAIRDSRIWRLLPTRLRHNLDGGYGFVYLYRRGAGCSLTEMPDPSQEKCDNP